MTEKSLLKKVMKQEMPDMEGVRSRCLQQEITTASSRSSVSVWVKRLVPVAACAVLAVTAILAVPQLTQNSSGDQTMNTSDEAQTGDSGVYIDKLTLQSEQSGEADSMIGLVVYNGNIYTQAEYIRCDDAEKEAFIGEYIGDAIGNIDEWSSQSEYSKELASNVTGEVYTVDGYDSSFRICIPEMVEGSGFIAFFENLNGITLTTGEDLYGSRLSLKGNYSDVLFQSHEDWDYDIGNFQTLDVSAEAITQFIDALYASPFVDLSGSDEDIYNENLQQVHLYFKMNDGSTVGIRLFENGYVGYANMYGRVFVSMSDSIFSTVFQAASN